MTKYNATGGEAVPPLINPFHVSPFTEQQVYYKLNSDNGEITVSCTFKNGFMDYCNLRFESGSPDYTQSQPTTILETANTLIQKYQNYVSQNYGASAFYLELPKRMLRSVIEFEPVSQVTGNVKLDISTEDKTRIQWIYTENNIEVPKKRIELELNSDGTFYCFRDSWNLYTVGTWDTISEEEVVSLALETAANYSITFAGENDIPYEVRPDMSNVTYDVWMQMAARNSSLLYPYWQVWFYLNERINNSVYGVAVGIWGDTREIAYCSELGYLRGTQTSP